MILLMIFLITVNFLPHFLDFASKVIWKKPLDWSGPEAAFYQNFDTSDGLVLWEGTNQRHVMFHWYLER